MRRKPRNEPRRPWRENVEAITMAIAVALLFKSFVVEVSKIPSGSMQPTLMGSPEAGVFDRVLVDKLSYRFRDPLRFEIAVFRHPLERSRIMVKRVVGMPGEELKIEHGDVWVRSGPDAPWRVPRRSDAIMDAMWREVRPDGPERPLFGVVEGGREWTVGSRRINARGEGRARFLPDRPSITNGYRDGYPEAIRRDVRSRNAAAGRTAVGDLRLEGKVRALEGLESLAVELVEGPRTYELVLPGPAAAEGARPEIRVRDGAARPGDGPVAQAGARVERGEPLRLPPKRTVRFAAQNLDDRLRLELDGEVLLEVEIEPAGDQRSGVLLSVRGTGADLDELRVLRDVHYLPQDVPRVVTIREGHYFFLGDNTLDSADGRDWKAVRYEWTDPEGTTHRRWGNWRPGRTRATAENPVWGPGPDGRTWTGFRDQWGERQWFPKSEGRQDLPVPEPLVPRELVQGRALAIFWPIAPHKGLWRLGWLP